MKQLGGIFGSMVNKLDHEISRLPLKECEVGLEGGNHPMKISGICRSKIQEGEVKGDFRSPK